jgi:predicted Fe-Mo cluster-binding NifX family protein
MNVAIPTLEDRVSPVFDVARAVVLVELDGDQELRRQTVPLHSQDVARRVAELSQHGVHVLICGAISRPLEATLGAAGIRVIPQTCGPVEDVLRAFVAGQLNDRAFVMPGCCGRRRRGWRGARQRAGCGRQQAKRPADEQTP